ncbi:MULTISPECIES: LacI family DNA-binding transcriptional regulator [Actinomadura]|uniref:Transcriptional regulator, LacI family n=2 Tax=Actinomadura madurae TaxID=1993 RepID=A0A1I5I685_9ACTN|nr:LacI family DNA-binding transcriptional regulator [Actinomadura madurae]SFO56148.1 transcriptional regulator, LacI family [Actinomadura madurae]SPT57430.1 Galactose operon repressor [Actinomadura madurae]
MMNRGAPRPTMRDVAAAAGVSLKTVSRVVNNESGVRPETEAAVRDAIALLGFHRNDLARTLRGGPTGTIGLVIQDVANPFYSLVARGVEDVAREAGRLMILGSSGDGHLREHVYRRERELTASLCERRVDGLLIVSSGAADRRLAEYGTPVVYIDQPGPLDVDTVLTDNAGGARAAVRHLLARGHRRIACLLDRTEVFTARERHRGYLAALAERGIAEDPAIARMMIQDAVGAERTMAELLGLPDPPTAVLTGNNLLTAGALRAIRAAAGPVALVGFDDFELADLLSVTVVAHDPAAMGRRAAELLERRIGGHAGPPEHVLNPTRLVERGSGEIPPPG